MTCSLSETALKRITQDLACFYEDKPYRIYIHPDENDISRLLILMIGIEDTPYEEGFFLFELQFPDNYPSEPPKIQIRTTNTEDFRYNPNFYIDGLICLSILGTFPGPIWSPNDLKLSHLLMLVQSRMNSKPLENEPGYENSSRKAKNDYNDAVRELTIRMSVIDQLMSKLPSTQMHPHMSFEVFRPVMQLHFLKNYEKYLENCDRIPTIVNTRFQNYSKKTNVSFLKEQIDKLKAQIEKS